MHTFDKWLTPSSRHYMHITKFGVSRPSMNSHVNCDIYIMVFRWKQNIPNSYARLNLNVFISTNGLGSDARIALNDCGCKVLILNSKISKSKCRSKMQNLKKQTRRARKKKTTANNMAVCVLKWLRNICIRIK